MLDFELSQEQKLLQQTAREFALKVLDPKVAAEYEKRREFPWELYRKAAEQGFIGMTWPVEYGGQGAKFLDMIIAHYELARVEPVLGTTIASGDFSAGIIANYGTHEQKAEWLPRLARGEIVSAGCYTEPSGGSDLSRRLDTQAIKRNGLWVINGVKTFISNATIASVYIVLVQTDLNVQPPYRGQTLFVLGKRPGIEATEFKEKLGWFVSPICEVRFKEVTATDQDIIGGPANLNRGFYITLEYFNADRVWAGAMALATAEAALERAISYAKERTAFGRKIAGFQGLAFRLVEMATKIEATKPFMYRCAWLIDRVKEDPSLREETIKSASMLKWYAARLAVESCDLAMDVMAGYGYIESDVMRWYRFAKALEITEGTKEMHKNTIARIMFGKEITKTF